MLSDLELLKGVRALLSDPKRWTWSAYARAKPVTRVEALGPTIEGLIHARIKTETSCYCVNGAVSVVDPTRDYAHHPMDKLLNGCLPVIDFDGAQRDFNNYIDEDRCMSVTFNDNCTHEQLLAALDCAIAKRS